MKKFLIAVVLLVLLLCLACLFFKPDIPEKIINRASEIFQGKTNEEPAEENSVPDSTKNGIANGESGNNNGESAESPAGSNPDADCILRQISYSLKEFKKTSVCNVYDGEICVDKILTCSLKVTNLDSELSGLFEIKFNFLKEDEMIDSEITSQSIEPRSSEIFTASYEYAGEDADKITCAFATEKIPEKEICS